MLPAQLTRNGKVSIGPEENSMCVAYNTFFQCVVVRYKLRLCCGCLYVGVRGHVNVNGRET